MRSCWRIASWLSSSLWTLLLVLPAANAATVAPHIPGMSQSGYWQAIRHRLTYIQEGHRGPVIYDFVDPNCPYCHDMYEEEQPLIQDGKVTVRYVLVAYLLPSSEPEAAAILQAPHPLAALRNFETIAARSFAAPETASGPAGLPRATPLPATAKALAANMQILQDARSMGVPAILYRRLGGSTSLLPGMLSQEGLSLLLTSAH